jgi:hypothetical protein
MKKIAILAPDGIGIRNYLYSNLIKEIYQYTEDITILHNLPESALKDVKKIHKLGELHSKRIPLYKETNYSKFLRELISLSRLRYNIYLTSNKTLLDNWFPQVNTIFKQVFYFIIKLLSFCFSKSYKLILWLEKKHFDSISTSYLDDFFKDNYDVILCTHQRSINAIPVIKKANKLRINTVGVVFSWDNLPKARLNVRTDKYLVWSQHMKKEMNLYYPEINSRNVFITGTPQFEFYENEKSIMSKSDFCNEYNLDINKPIVCFSGDDERTSPNDPQYLYDIANEINKLPLEEQPQILFRRCPVDFSDRYDKVINKFSNLIKISNPIWKYGDQSDWSSIYPKYADVELLINVVSHCDVVINLGSTMALDFAVYNKPAIYINYHAENTNGWSVERLYNFEHFKSMPSTNSVYWINKKEEILEIVDQAIQKKGKLTNVEWLNIIAEKRSQASSNIAKEIIK